MPVLTAVQVGQEFAGRQKTISWQRLWAFSGGPFSASGWPRKNIHTDLEFAQSTGLDTVAASGTQYQGHIAELLIDMFGEAWLSSGTLQIKFIKVVPDGDVLTAKAKIESVNGKTVSMEAWSENQNGDRVATGSATGQLA